jgi:hypothetical protein
MLAARNIRVPDLTAASSQKGEVMIATTEQLTKPKIIPKMPFDEYCRIDAVNVSTLLLLAGTTPESAHHRMLTGGDETEATLRGHATHAAVLEPDVFDALYARQPEFGDCRTKGNRDKRDQWRESHAHSILLDADEYDLCCLIRDRLKQTPHLNALFSGPGQNEITILWRDEPTGLACKGRIDRLTTYMSWQTLIDLKTARSIGDHDISKSIAMYHYHTRLAWYMDSLNAIKRSEWRPVIVWACTAAPYEQRATEFDDCDIDEGRMEYRTLLDQYAKCKAENIWPTYPAGIDVLGLPRWAYKYTVPQET